jgi:hypothetical protein
MWMAKECFRFGRVSEHPNRKASRDAMREAAAGAGLSPAGAWQPHQPCRSAG